MLAALFDLGKAPFRHRRLPVDLEAINLLRPRTKFQFFGLPLHIVAALGVLITLSAPTRAVAADISLHDRGVLIKGHIQEGDYAKIVQFIRRPHNFDRFARAVFLDSSGGDLLESIRISHLLDKISAATFVDDGARCLRACFVLWMSGVTRHVSKRATLGIGNIPFDAEEKSNSSRYVGVARRLDHYLAVLGTPQMILDMMIAAAPSDLYIVTSRWLTDQRLLSAMSYRPRFLELSESICGAEPFAAILKDMTPLSDENYQRWLLQFRNWNTCVDALRVQRQRADAAVIAALMEE